MSNYYRRYIVKNQKTNKVIVVPKHFLRIENGYEVDGETGEAVHRIIYKETYGDIFYGYVIHHIDGRKLNNDIKNLIALPRDFHTYLHCKYLLSNLPDRELITIELEHWSKLTDEYFSLLERKKILQQALFLFSHPARKNSGSRVKPSNKKHRSRKR